jgi:adenylate cyclase
MDKTNFVAREPELARLSQLLDAALAGKGQVCFLAGEAGSGKTTLLAEFTRRAQDRNPDLVAALGQCDAQTGIGDAYLPFREVLAELVGDADVERRVGSFSNENKNRLRKLLSISAQVLVEVGPDLVGILIPFGKIITLFATQTAKKVGWMEKLEQLARKPKPGQAGVLQSADQDQVFEQYTRFLLKLSEKTPLLLILDDLQWADSPSVALLFRLGRRIADSRIMILGTYRPEEVAQERNGERHPLEKVLAEFKRYFGEIEIDLGSEADAERRHFVDALVDSEPNRLEEDFRQALYNHTDGHALFTVELLRALQERGDLKQDAMGRWVAGPELDWMALPARVEGVIEERIGRLEEKLRSALKVASVEGEDFTAEVVARVRTVDTRDLTRRLSEEVQKEHHLVQAQGLKRLDNERLSLFRFEHNLFQQYLYNGLDPVERATLHEDVGNVIEALYGERAEDVAPQLARHFGQAGLPVKAAHYLQISGEQAAARYANQEALGDFNQALALVPERETLKRYHLLLDREKVYDILAQREVQRQDVVALETLAQSLGAEAQAEAAVRKANYFIAANDYQAAVIAAQSAFHLAQGAGLPADEAAARLCLGDALFNLSQFSEAKQELEQARSKAQSAGLPHLEARSLRTLASVLEVSGDFKGVKTSLEQALQINRMLGDQRAEADTLAGLGRLYGIIGNKEQTKTYFEMSLEICRLIGDRAGEISPMESLGGINIEDGEIDLGREKLEQAMLIAKEIGNRRYQGKIMWDLLDIYEWQGHYLVGRDYALQALKLSQEIGNRWGEAADLVRLGQFYYELGDFETARADHARALEIARAISQPRVEVWALGCIGDDLLSLGDMSGAWNYYEQSLHIAREINSPEGEAWNFIYESEVLERQGRFAEAIEAHSRASELFTKISYGVPFMLFVNARLASIYLSKGEPAKALSELTLVFEFIDTHGSLDGIYSTIKIYLICCQVLQANQDRRARDILQAAYTMLQERAARIDDEALRRSYLENVPANREIAHLWAQEQGR